MAALENDFSDRLKAIGEQISSLRLIDRKQGLDYIRQSIVHAQIRDRVQEIIKELLAELRSKKSQMNISKYGRREHERRRKELSRLYVTAQLFQVDLSLFYIRWMAAVDWFEEAGSTASPLDDVNAILSKLKQSFGRRRSQRKRGIKLTSLAFHAIATDLRAWADKLSAEACTASGWLSSASAVSRTLRKSYHRYRTKEISASIWEPLHVEERSRAPLWWERIPPLRVLIRSLRAILRRCYGIVAGYGLGAGNFVVSTCILLFSFAAIYWGIDASAGCTQSAFEWRTPLDYLLRSLSIFTTLGNVSGTLCSLDGDSIQRMASIESIFGYVMLSILISVFWMSFHESVTGISNIRLRQMEDSSSYAEHSLGAAGPPDLPSVR